jgi:hypothetical protein
MYETMVVVGLIGLFIFFLILVILIELEFQVLDIIV